MIGPHVPSVPWPFFTAEHASHVPTQALLQQMLSTQKLDKHAAFPAHVAPKSSLHVLAPLHDPLVHSLSGSVAVMIGPQVPSVPWPFFAVVHASHVPTQALLQQTLSAQKLDAQSAGAAQTWPGPFLHTPLPLHTSVPPQTGLVSVPLLGMLAHVPFVPAPAATEHARQVPAHASLQQTPSAQKPLEHSPPRTHTCPAAFLAAHRFDALQ
jgi:hypothetical protein